MTAPAPDGGIEIESLDQLDERLASGKGLAECSLQSLDLTGHGEALLAADVTRAMFLGCDFGPGVEHALERRGALVFPTLPDLPFNPYRSGLYVEPRAVGVERQIGQRGEDQGAPPFQRVLHTGAEITAEEHRTGHVRGQQRLAVPGQVQRLQGALGQALAGREPFVELVERFDLDPAVRRRRGHASEPGSSGTSAANSARISNGTTSSACRFVDASTTGGATPAA